MFGVGVPALLRAFGRLSQDATLGFAIGVVVMNQTQRNFGPLGDLLAVLLFVFVATTIEWQRVWTGIGLALALIVVRLAVKMFVVGSLARMSGISWHKGVLTGMAMAPMSVFVILLWSRHASSASILWIS